ncbi:MAG: hypothetical protein R6U32_02660 [Candidatus Woesearchaeota archaeon]
MDAKKWKFLQHGPSEALIQKKRKLDIGRRGLIPIVEALDTIKEDEYILIPKEQMVFPRRHDSLTHEMEGREFKKRGPQFNLKTKTASERAEQRIGPQQLILEEITKTMERESDVEYVLKRGFKWDKASAGTMHTIMPQRDLMAGWRLASLCIHAELDLRYSNPGGIFLIGLPSRKSDPGVKENRYVVELYNFATELPEGYESWPNIDGSLSMEEGRAEKALRGIDIFSKASQRYNIQEMRFNFQFVAAAILRNHYTDKRYHQGRFNNAKRVEDQPIDPVLLNATIPPTKEFIEFDHKLQNNILIEPSGKDTQGRQKKPKKLNAGEREPFYCVFQYIHGAGSSYIHDEELNSLDSVVAHQKEAMDKVLNIK